jgi:hypothetical protein
MVWPKTTLPFIVCFWRNSPQWASSSSFMRFLDHTQQSTAFGRTPLYEWSAHRRDLYLTTHNIHNRQTSMPPVGFESTKSAGERLQIYALDRAATGSGNSTFYPFEMCKTINCRNYFHPEDAFLKTLRTLLDLLRLSVCLSDYAQAIFPSWLRTVKLFGFPRSLAKCPAHRCLRFAVVQTAGVATCSACNTPVNSLSYQ